MEPEFRDGWVVYIDKHAQAKHGDFVVARRGDAILPRLRQLVIEGDVRYLQALNPAHPERLVVLDDGAVILGRVVFQGKSY